MVFASSFFIMTRFPGFINSNFGSFKQFSYEKCDHLPRCLCGRIPSKVRPDTGPDTFLKSGRNTGPNSMSGTPLISTIMIYSTVIEKSPLLLSVVINHLRFLSLPIFIGSCNKITGTGRTLATFSLT